MMTFDYCPTCGRSPEDCPCPVCGVPFRSGGPQTPPPPPGEGGAILAAPGALHAVTLWEHTSAMVHEGQVQDQGDQGWSSLQRQTLTGDMAAGAINRVGEDWLAADYQLGCVDPAAFTVDPAGRLVLVTS